MTGDLPWRETPEGVELAVRLTPRAGATRIEGILHDSGGCWLKLRVAAPPVDGAANAEMIAHLAKVVGIPRGDIALIAGARGRAKRLQLRGKGLPARLAALLPGD